MTGGALVGGSDQGLVWPGGLGILDGDEAGIAEQMFSLLRRRR
jgi:hypothetical protein